MPPAASPRSLEKSGGAWAVLFFSALLLLGLFCFRDYGLPWDDPKQRWIGTENLKIAVQEKSELPEVQEQYYGPAYEILLVAAEKILRIEKDTEKVFLMRHLAIFLTFVFSGYFFFRLAERLLGNWQAGLTAASFLIFSPRIFADAFYNSKDIGFLAAFILVFYTLQKLFHKKTTAAALLHALTCAVLIDIRIAGVLAVAFTVIGLTIRRDFKPLFIFLPATFALAVLFWPAAWHSPASHFLEAFKAMQHYNWGGTVLYFGEYLKGDQIPWHYIPVWIGITTPLPYLLFFGLGLFAWRRHFKSFTAEPLYLLILLWLFLPLFWVIRSKTTLYDGWRQFYFIYPPLILIAAAGFGELASQLKRRVFIWGILALTLLPTAAIMFKIHPYQNLYFNRLAGKNLSEIKMKFDLDYWGLSYRKGLEFLLKYTDAREIKVHPGNYAGDINERLLSAKDQERLIFVRSMDEADYFIGNYRWHKEDYPFSREIYSVSVSGAKILAVYQLSPQDRFFPTETSPS